MSLEEAEALVGKWVACTCQGCRAHYRETGVWAVVGRVESADMHIGVATVRISGGGSVTDSARALTDSEILEYLL